MECKSKCLNEVKHTTNVWHPCIEGKIVVYCIKNIYSKGVIFLMSNSQKPLKGWSNTDFDTKYKREPDQIINLKGKRNGKRHTGVVSCLEGLGRRLSLYL